MLLRYSFDMEEDAALIERAATDVLASGLRTADVMAPGAAQGRHVGHGRQHPARTGQARSLGSGVGGFTVAGLAVSVTSPVAGLDQVR